jgi:hypothetical protein
MSARVGLACRASGRQNSASPTNANRPASRRRR